MPDQQSDERGGAAAVSEEAPMVDEQKHGGRATALAFLGGILVALLAAHLFGRASPSSLVAPRDSKRPGASIADRDRLGVLGQGQTIHPSASGTAGSARLEDMEICGMPGVALNPATRLNDDPRFAARMDAANKRFIDALSTNADERVRAAALLLERMEALRLATRADAESLNALCGEDARCIKAAQQQAPRATILQSMAPATDALARAAATTTNPAVYASAVDACSGWSAESTASPVPSCALLSPEQWAHIDPDNADAWLHVAGTAAARKDAGALDDAMYHVAHATGSRLYGDTIASLVDSAIPAGSDDFEASQMHVTSWTLWAGWSLPPLQTVTAYCAEPTLADSNRRQICDAVAHQLVDNGSSMIERSIGIRLASRLGWPADLVSSLRREQDALQRAQNVGSAAFGEIASCRAVDKLRGMVAQAGRLGEVGAARAALAASGRTIADLAADIEVERGSVSASAANQNVQASSPSAAASAS